MSKTLKEYVKEKELSVDLCAERVGVTPAAFYRYMSGTRTPRPIIAHEIVKLCQGEVSFESLYSS